jgi:hypothetical protein
MNTFGEVSYEDDVFVGGKKDNKENNKDLWMRLVEGENEVRLVTAPFQYLVHKFKKDPSNPKDFGQKIKCSAIHGSCPLCDLGDKAKPRWFYGVIDRKTGAYKILDVSYMVFSAIRKLAKNSKWGDPTKYDINIEVDKNGGATGYYSVQPLSKDPLSAADQTLKDNADLDDLKKRCTPHTPDVVQKIMDKINGVVSAAAPAGKTTSKTAAKAPVKAAATVSMTDDEELSKDFPDYNAGESAES